MTESRELLRALPDGCSRLTIKDAELELFHAGEGPPLLFLHGGGGFDPQARFLELLAAHFEILAPSHPGFGRSSLPERFTSVDDLAFLYLDLLDALELEQVVLLGCSLGGWIAAEVATRCAHRLERLILVGAVGIKVGDRAGGDIPEIFTLPAEEVVRLALHDPARAAGHAELTDEELAMLARNREALARYAAAPYMHNPKLRYHLSRIRLPALLLRGASDGLVSQAYAEAYAALIPGARLELIAEAGHAPQIEQPERFAERVIAFAAG